jgi:hypothetical protein
MARPRVKSARASSIVFLLAAACTDPSYTMVHVDVKPQAGITLDSYDVHVGEFEQSMPPTNTFDVVVPTPSVGQPTAVIVAAMDAGKQVAYGAAMVTPAEGLTTDTMISLTANTCASSCTPGETVCSNSGEATVTCEIGSGGCFDWSAPKTCPTSAPFCSNGACAASCSNECSNVGDTDCDGTAVRTCQTSPNDSCLHWSVPVTCDSPQLDECLDSMTLATYGSGTCSNGACEYAPFEETCESPANGSGACSENTCVYTCDSGYVSDGNGNCIVQATCGVLECTVDADCGDPSCGPCSGSLCLGALESGGL